MTLSREAMMDLMAYADGELDDASRARVEALLRTNAEARGVVDAMGTLGDAVRSTAELSGEAGAKVDAIADGVMATIARAPAADGEKKVVSIAPARAKRGGAAAGIFVALALAAAVLLFLKNGDRASSVAKEEPLAPGAAASPAASVFGTNTPPAEAVAQGEGSDEPEDPGVNLEEASSPKNKINVYFVPQSNAMTSVVVWIDDHHQATP
jgi:anti-sigma factor RsiW